MNSLRIVTAVAAVAAALSACSAGAGAVGTPGSPAAPPPSATAAPTASTTTGQEPAVEAAFRGYYQALLARDFATACGLQAPEMTAKLLGKLSAQGAPVASCADGLAKVYAAPSAATVADGISKSAQVQKITVAGDDATVSWSAEVHGRRPVVSNGLHRIDGQWRLLD